MLADVVLPILHDRLISWDRARPDILQHMLLAGLAVDSPGDTGPDAVRARLRAWVPEYQR